jgi:5,10-methylenetetrahydrofolate reductase
LIEDFIAKLKSETFLTLETTPRRSASMSKLIDDIKLYNLDQRIDGFVTTDNPLAKLKYNSILAAIKLQNEFNKAVMVTMSMRDRNKLALQSDLLGANDFDIRAILALTGDPAKMSDQPYLKGVFEGNSNILLKIISLFNEGLSYSGVKLLDRPKTIYPFCVINSFYKSETNFRKKLYSKIENHCLGIVTQPVYDKQNLDNIIRIFNETKNSFTDSRRDTELIIGMFPVTKLRTAQFLDSHVPGVYVPNIWIDNLKKASHISEDEEYKVGLELSQNLFDTIYKTHPKIHMMTANNFKLADRLISII